MSNVSQNFRLFRLSTLSVLNIRFYSLMYTGLLTQSLSRTLDARAEGRLRPEPEFARDVARHNIADGFGDGLLTDC